jgi:hypothetical protein
MDTTLGIEVHSPQQVCSTQFVRYSTWYDPQSTLKDVMMPNPEIRTGDEGGCHDWHLPFEGNWHSI